MCTASVWQYFPFQFRANIFVKHWNNHPEICKPFSILPVRWSDIIVSILVENILLITLPHPLAMRNPHHQ